MGFVGGDAIGDAPRRLGPAKGVVHLLAQTGVALQQVVLDAAARYRAHGLAVLAQRHHRAYGAGRGAPGAHDRGEHGMQALGAPAVELLEDGEVDVVHGGGSFFLGLAGHPSTSSGRTVILGLVRRLQANGMTRIHRAQTNRNTASHQKAQDKRLASAKFRPATAPP